MGETTGQLEDVIEDSREALKSNLEELQTRVKDAADWRYLTRRHPVPMLVAAVVGGMLVAALFGRR